MVNSNIVREIRSRLKLSQQKFAGILDISLGSVRAYEAGARLSDGVIEKLKTVAAKHKMPEYALALDQRSFGVQKVFEPGSRVRLAKRPEGADIGDALHNDLDAILDSGDPEIIAALEITLRSFRNSAKSRK